VIVFVPDVDVDDVEEEDDDEDDDVDVVEDGVLPDVPVVPVPVALIEG